MGLLLDAFWRALAYLLMPRVIGLSLLPLLICGGLAVGLAWFFWEPAVDGVHALLTSGSLIEPALKWVETWLGPNFRVMLASILIVALAAPVLLALSLMLVALLMTPAIVSLVAERRFPQLERRKGAAFWQGVLWSLGCTLLALVAVLATMPFWLIPGVVLIVPPLIWGWLTTRVMCFDTLADHATQDERRTLMGLHNWQLLLIGITSGFLSAVPSLLWAFSVTALVFAPVLILVSVWLYTLLFAFSSLWFAHYLLAALQAERVRAAGALAEAVGAASTPAAIPDLPGTGP
ncbi:MAG: EI24 domain-containing protein [Pseudomonadota bacterium]